MDRKRKLISFMVIVLLVGVISATLAAFVPGTGETVKINLMDASAPTASPVTYPDGQEYVELNDIYGLGETFTVWANVTSVTELLWYQMGVTYNDSILECTSYSEGEFFYRADEQYRTNPPNQPVLFDSSGYLGYYNVVAWVLLKPGCVSGTGTLAVFNFEVVGYGATLIDIILSDAPQAALTDVNDVDIDFNTIDVVFDNRGMNPNRVRTPRSGNISVPAAAFVPSSNTMNWRNLGTLLRNYEISGTATFYAAVQLPQGATVTNLTFYWFDNGIDSALECRLYRYDQTMTWLIAYASNSPPSNAPGDGVSYDDDGIINYAVVDNNKYAYLLGAWVPAPSGTYEFHYAVIEYEY